MNLLLSSPVSRLGHRLPFNEWRFSKGEEEEEEEQEQEEQQEEIRKRWRKYFDPSPLSFFLSSSYLSMPYRPSVDDRESEGKEGKRGFREKKREDR